MGVNTVVIQGNSVQLNLLNNNIKGSKKLNYPVFIIINIHI